MAKTSGNKARAKRLCVLMDATGLAAPQLATAMGIARATVYHWRIGRCFPSRNIQPRLAKRLGVSVAELNGWAS